MKKRSLRRTKLPETKHFYVLSIVLMLFIIGVLAGLSFEPELKQLDQALYDSLAQKQSTIVAGTLNPFAHLFTILGNVELISVFLLGLVIYLMKHKRPHAAQALLMSTFTAGVLIQVLKLTIGRERPDAYIEIATFGLSFPSGHAFISVVFYGFLAFLLARRTRNKRRKRQIYLFTAVGVLLIAASRVWLGVHWLTDVIGGLILGMLLLWLITSFYDLNKHRSG